MFQPIRRISGLLEVIAALAFVACDDSNEPPALEVPDTYEFTRNGQSCVFYGGQTDRLNQTSEIKAYLQKGDRKELTLSAQDLYDMYANTDGNGAGNFSFASDRQLRDKNFTADVRLFA